MTPQQIKAKDLVEKMYQYSRSIHKANAKQCAIIAVEMILESKKLDYLFSKEEINSMEYTSDEAWIKERFDLYWQKVKEEIEKL